MTLPMPDPQPTAEASPSALFTHAATSTAAPPSLDVLGMLAEGSQSHRLTGLGGLLLELKSWMGTDLAEVEADLLAMECQDTPVHHSARHLLSGGGKRLRPLCVALAARTGSGFGPHARQLAVAVELVHSATLLHDDVIDLGDRRRGEKTARIIYGNAASIYSGDWLLVDALRRIAGTGLPDLLDKSLAVLREILEAEALQLKNRRQVYSSAADYFRVVQGKTASLFGWALFAGGRAGGMPQAQCLELEQYGQRLGVAFQVIDDLLDLTGDPAVLGKSLFADLHEGKMTYPLHLAIERSPALAQDLTAAFQTPDAELPPSLDRRLRAVLQEAGVLTDCLALATKLSEEAIAALHNLPKTRARTALERVAIALVNRDR